MTHDQSERATSHWENEGGHTRPSLDMAPGGLGEELDRYGIKAVPFTVFEWGGYRYTNASDAIAAAKRSAR